MAEEKYVTKDEFRQFVSRFNALVNELNVAGIRKPVTFSEYEYFEDSFDGDGVSIDQELTENADDEPKKEKQFEL